jgi:hypothetical protein
VLHDAEPAAAVNADTRADGTSRPAGIVPAPGQGAGKRIIRPCQMLTGVFTPVVAVDLLPSAAEWCLVRNSAAQAGEILNCAAKCSRLSGQGHLTDVSAMPLPAEFRGCSEVGKRPTGERAYST